MHRGVSGLGIGLLVAVLAGCGGASSGPAPTDYKATLTELGEALKTTAADGKRPPTRLTEFQQIEPMAPTAAPLVRSGEIVYLWGAGFAPGGTKLVAFEKKAETDGGLVLLQDGSVKRMSADEVKSAPRAGTAGPASR
jgi:hypothetical protein